MDIEENSNIDKHKCLLHNGNTIRIRNFKPGRDLNKCDNKLYGHGKITTLTNTHAYYTVVFLSQWEIYTCLQHKFDIMLDGYRRK